ncbi:hypothetical protein K1X12_12035 [Hyphomonas sp. WL0036]|uniref:hypothetical protein n=1 Tax=Hyphomonas sediminis TaxID=2866160 RepID=UPI001C81C453|nr:hypothetical protein [Hyphomonas sediminis]MBY9067632.1 hypothetical protein [Hyphomonas sediminis]
MSFADKDEFASFLSGEVELPQMTEEAVSDALAGFRLELAEGRSLAWLAMATRRALSISIPNPSDSPDRMSNADIQKKLLQLANDAQSTWQKLFEIEWPVDAYLWHYAWGDESDQYDENGMIIGNPGLIDRYNAAVNELDWVATFLRNAAKNVQKQKGAWKRSELRQLRVERGLYLATVFEAAFGDSPTANNFPSDARHKAPTAFMDFYERMVTLAFGKRDMQDLSGVLKEVCRKHAAYPAQFVDGLIPDL